MNKEEESINADEGSLTSYFDDLTVEETSDEKERALESIDNPRETSSNEFINEVCPSKMVEYLNHR